MLWRAPTQVSGIAGAPLPACPDGVHGQPGPVDLAWRWRRRGVGTPRRHRPAIAGVRRSDCCYRSLPEFAYYPDSKLHEALIAIFGNNSHTGHCRAERDGVHHPGPPLASFRATPSRSLRLPVPLGDANPRSARRIPNSHAIALLTHSLSSKRRCGRDGQPSRLRSIMDVAPHSRFPCRHRSAHRYRGDLPGPQRRSSSCSCSTRRLHPLPMCG